MRYAPITLILLSTFSLVRAVDPNDELRTHVTAYVNHTESGKRTNDPSFQKLASESHEKALEVARQQIKLPDPANVDPRNSASLVHHANGFGLNTYHSKFHQDAVHYWDDRAKNAKEPSDKVTFTTHALKSLATADAYRDLASAHKDKLFNATYEYHSPGQVKSHLDPDKPDHQTASHAHGVASIMHRHESGEYMKETQRVRDRMQLAALVTKAAKSEAIARKHDAMAAEYGRKAQSQPQPQPDGQDRGGKTPPGGQDRGPNPPPGGQGGKKSRSRWREIGRMFQTQRNK